MNTNNDLPFSNWQGKQCSGCQVMRPCKGETYNYEDYKAGTLNMKKGCPYMEHP